MLKNYCWANKNIMQLFYERIIRKIKNKYKTLPAIAKALNSVASEKGIDTNIKPQNVDMWLKGSIPTGEFAKVIEYYMYEYLTASELLDILNIKLLED